MDSSAAIYFCSQDTDTQIKKILTQVDFFWDLGEVIVLHW